MPRVTLGPSDLVDLRKMEPLRSGLPVGARLRLEEGPQLLLGRSFSELEQVVPDLQKVGGRPGEESYRFRVADGVSAQFDLKGNKVCRITLQNGKTQVVIDPDVAAESARAATAEDVFAEAGQKLTYAELLRYDSPDSRPGQDPVAFSAILPNYRWKLMRAMFDLNRTIARVNGLSYRLLELPDRGDIPPVAYLLGFRRYVEEVSGPPEAVEAFRKDPRRVAWA